MARPRNGTGYGNLEIAHKSPFAALAVDVEDSSDEEIVLETPASVSNSTPSTPSKKAAARKRAQLRKKESKSTLKNSDSDEKRDAPKLPNLSIPPVPSLPSKEKLNGLETKAEEQAKNAVEQAKSSVEQVKESLPSLPSLAPTSRPAVNRNQSVMTSATVSDAETQENYSESDDDDDVTDTEEQKTPTDTRPPAVPAQVATKPSNQTGEPNKKGEAYTGADHDPGKKRKAIITRTVWGLVMGISALTIIGLGPLYVILLIFAMQTTVYSELTGLFDQGYSSTHTETDNNTSQRSIERELRRKGRREERDRWSRRLCWYFFAATNYFLYGESLIYYFKHILTVQASFLPTSFSFAQHHRLISFGLYVIGFVSFVANLTRAQLRRQFGLFGWIHMSLLLIVVSSHFIVNNILEGMIWFFVPASLVIFNDIAAYVCGMLFGRHQLIKLSPKKTVEGFVGAFFVTILLAIGWGTLFMKWNFMICPVKDLSWNAFSKIECTPNQTFRWLQFPLPNSVTNTIHTLFGKTVTSIPWSPFQLHCVVLAIFASLVAPFGGFFASGFKRAFNIKDFGDSIPGHGGMTDRMDCQFLMGLFSYVYYAALIRETHVSVGSIIATVLSSLDTDQQIELVVELSRHLTRKGISAANVGGWGK